MRLTFLEDPKIKVRTIKRFAFFPTKLDSGQVIWLEYFYSEESWYSGGGFRDATWDIDKRSKVREILEKE